MKRFLIDSDTASDDAAAILMALKTPELLVEAITIVAGNVDVNQGATNALNTLELCEAKVPVYKGLRKPLFREHVNATFFHGQDGMGNLNLPSPKLVVSPGNAVDIIIDTIHASPQELTIVALGPLSNIAAAILQEPRIVDEVGEVYVMGGAANTVGNVTPSAEYNIWCDPEAAKIVFHSGIPLLLIGWENTIGQSLLFEDDMKQLRSFKTPIADFILDSNLSALNASRSWLGFDGLCLPDAVAMAVAIDRSICTHSEWKYVDVEVQSDLTRGETVVDRFNVLNKQPNIEVCFSVDSQKFKELLFSISK